jgi:hypothetical protein
MLDDHNFKLMNLHDVTTQKPQASQVVDDASTELLAPDFLWDDVAQNYEEDATPVSIVESSPKKERSPSKRRRSKRRKQNVESTDTPKGSDEAPDQVSRRRRRRRSKQNEEGEQDKKP